MRVCCHNNNPKTFTAKKSQFSGVNLYAINKFKAPIEKFNSDNPLKELNNWIKVIVSEKFELSQYESELKQVNNERMGRLYNWKQYLTKLNPVYTATPALALIVISAITKNIQKNNNEQPPILNPGALARTAEEMEIRLRDRKARFNFLKHYTINLRKSEMGVNPQRSGDYTGWITLPSLKNDSKNFLSNVEKLKALSHPNWCTASFNAKPYLSKGDFHIYMQAGTPKLGVRFENENIVEIQGELNNQKIPLNFLDILSKHITDNSLKTNHRAAKQIEIADAAAKEVKDFTTKYQKEIENFDVEKILTILNCEPTLLDDGTYKIKNYDPKCLFNEITLSEIGIDEEKLLDNVSEITEECSLIDSKIQTFKRLKSVGKNLYISNCTQLKNLGNIEHVGHLWVKGNSKLNNLGKLKRIDGNLYIATEGLKTLGDLEFVGGNARLEFSQVNSLSKLKFIGKDFYASRFLKSLGELEEIGGDAYLSDCDINSLEELKKVGKTLYIIGTPIETKPKLKFVGNSVHFSNENDSIEYVNLADFLKNFI